MVIGIIDLKQNKYKVQRLNDDSLMKLSSSRYQVNNSLIVLFTFKKSIILFSFLLAKIFKMSLEDYKKYLKNFSQNLLIPKPLLDLSIIVPQTNSLRIPQPDYYFRNLQLNLTPNCNLRCRYCYAMSGQRPDRQIMSFQLAKATIDYVTNYCGNKLNLIFVGEGEPSTEFPLLKKIFYYAKRKIPQVVINPISTNGVISKKVADWLIKNAETVQISCDGPAFIQNKYRPLANGKGSSAFVENTIKYFVKKKKDFRVRATMTEDLFGNELKIMNYFWNLGVKNFSFGPLENIGAAKIMVLDPKFKQTQKLNRLPILFQEFQKLMELQNELEIRIELLNFRLLGTTVTCGIYKKSNFVIDPHGYVSACDRHNDSNDFKKYPFMKDFIIGHYDFETKKFKIDFKKIDDLKRQIDHQLEINKCQQCPLLSACSTICLYQLGQKTGFLDPSTPTCGSTEQISPTLTFSYFSQRYLINKKPCLEFKNNKLFYSLLYTDFELSFTKNGVHLTNNPYILIDKLDNLELLSRKIITYKNKRDDLTVFLLNFQIEQEFLNKTYAKKIINFLKQLKNSRVYFRITEPLPRRMFGKNYNTICEEFNIPKSYQECLELYRVKNNTIYFSKDKRGSKKFSEYEDRDEIYQDFLSISDLSISMF